MSTLDAYAVIGNPISHSKSPLIHTAFARQTEQAMHYDAILAPINEFRETVTAFQQQDGKGMNVTVPFKLEAYEFATRLTERAELAQAVNTLQFVKNEIVGDNTDGAGLVRDIEMNLGISLNSKRILLMGAGGAARGVILPILKQNPGVLAIANRTPQKAQQLQQQFAQHGALVSGHYMDFSGESFDIIINATSASLHDKLPELPLSIFAKDSLAYDMMYAHELTRFLAFAEQNGASYLADGIGMLVEQAAESFFLWRGIRPQTEPIIAQLKTHT